MLTRTFNPATAPKPHVQYSGVLSGSVVEGEFEVVTYRVEVEFRFLRTGRRYLSGSGCTRRGRAWAARRAGEEFFESVFRLSEMDAQLASDTREILIARGANEIIIEAHIAAFFTFQYAPPGYPTVPVA